MNRQGGKEDGLHRRTCFFLGSYRSIYWLSSL